MPDFFQRAAFFFCFFALASSFSGASSVTNVAVLYEDRVWECLGYDDLLSRCSAGSSSLSSVLCERRSFVSSLAGSSTVWCGVV